MFAPVKGDPRMKSIDHLKALLVEQIEKTDDADLLDLLLKIVTAEARQ